MNIVRVLGRRLLWAIAWGLVGFVLIEAMGGADSFIWAVATCVVYLCLTGFAGRLDEKYSQGPHGPTPPETYS